MPVLAIQRDRIMRTLLAVLERSSGGLEGDEGSKSGAI
jgi:hypothetical protein